MSKQNYEEFKDSDLNANSDEVSASDDSIISYSFNNTPDSQTSNNQILDQNEDERNFGIDDSYSLSLEEVEALNDLISEPNVSNLNQSSDIFSSDIENSSSFLEYLKERTSSEEYRELFDMWGGSYLDFDFDRYLEILRKKVDESQDELSIRYLASCLNFSEEDINPENFFEKICDRLKEWTLEKGEEKIKNLIKKMLFTLFFWNMVKFLLSVSREGIDIEENSIKENDKELLNSLKQSVQRSINNIKTGEPSLDKKDIEKIIDYKNIENMVEKQSKIQRFLFRLSVISYDKGNFINQGNAFINNIIPPVSKQMFNRKYITKAAVFLKKFFKKF